MAPLLNQGCLPVTGSGSATSDAEAATCLGTPQIFGKWKKLTGYNGVQPSNAQLEYDFHIMVVERGDKMCEALVVNKAQQYSPRYRADYIHSISEKSLNITYKEVRSDSGIGDETTVSAKYTFGCSNNKRAMTLEYSDGFVETYEIWSSSVNTGDCNP